MIEYFKQSNGRYGFAVITLEPLPLVTLDHELELWELAQLFGGGN